MDTWHLTESTESAALPMDAEVAARLNRLGRALASQSRWWGAAEGPEEDPAERSVIRCRSTDGRGWRVRVDNAVGVVAVGDVQLIVQPKIPTPHLLHLLGVAGSLPRFEEGAAFIAPDQSLWDLVATWYVNSPRAAPPS